MVEMQIEYLGELRCQAAHGPSGVTIQTDAPVDNHGRGESFSPTDTVAMALAACELTIMGIKAKDKGWSLEGTKVRVEKHMSASPRRIARIVLEFQLPEALAPQQRDLLQRAAMQCPVKNSLHPDIELEHHF
ncbi:MAG: OsmC family protein [Xanthomonadales bacterium]|jgi:putative redox protein|nr:OsmC family protein [Xanthomonadales bacterium]